MAWISRPVLMDDHRPATRRASGGGQEGRDRSRTR